MLAFRCLYFYGVPNAVTLARAVKLPEESKEAIVVVPYLKINLVPDCVMVNAVAPFVIKLAEVTLVVAVTFAALALPATNKLFVPAPVAVPIETPPPLDRRIPSVPFALNSTGAATSVPNTKRILLAS